LSKNSSPEHASSKEHRSSLEPLEVDSSGDAATGDREYENAAHSDDTSVEGYGCTNESINEIHSYQVREGNDLEDSKVVLCGPTSHETDNTDSVESESDVYEYLYENYPIREDEVFS
jgi:hypothetical protein